jgi:hypothetical protein
MIRETIGGSAFRVKNPATAKKTKRWMQSMKASWACQEIHDGSTTDELVKILLNLTFHSAVTSAIERFVFLTYIIASTLSCGYLFWRGPEMTHRDAFGFYLWTAKPMTSEFEVSSRWCQCSLLYPTTGGNHP